MAQLPQELIIEILLWLPVKSLKRFRCLSQSLCAVIDGPDFLNSHLSWSSQNFNRKLIFQDRSSKKFHVFDVNVDVEDDILRLGQPVSSLRTICGNCKGLLLLYQSTGHRRKYRFTLWNPSTRKYRFLPDFSFEVPDDVQFHAINGTGLGYDDSIDDYKAILRVYVNRGIGVEVQVWIYGLKSNIWRRAQNFPYIGDRVYWDEGFPGIGYFTNGSLHWICSLFSNRNDNQQPVDLRIEIVAFDVRRETFSLVPQPVICSINSVVSASPKLHVLEGCLCISYLYCSTPVRADLYIRKKDRVDQFSWTKLFSITEPLPFDISMLDNLKVLGYSKRGDKILIDLGMAYMVSYDLKGKSFRKVEIDKDPTWNALFLCLESLFD